MLPYLAYIADQSRRHSLHARFGPGLTLSQQALRLIGAVALRLGWRFAVWGEASFVTAFRPNGRVYGDGNPWRERSPAISIAAGMSLASRP